jgi:hypothetical protein
VNKIPPKRTNSATLRVHPIRILRQNEVPTAVCRPGEVYVYCDARGRWWAERMLANAVTEPITITAYETEGEAVQAVAEALSQVAS